MTWELKLGEPSENPARNSVGGAPYLPPGIAPPNCAMCNARLTLFFQVDVTEGPLAGRHLVVFACPKHDDVWGGIYHGGKIIYPPGQLPDGYWKAGGHYHVATYAGDLVANEPDGRLIGRPLQLVPHGEPDEVIFRLGGKAPYVDKLDYKCSCGQPMVQLVEVPDNFEFPLAPGHKSQSGSPSHTADVLFLGNFLLIMSCSAPCDDRAIVVYMVN